MGRAAGAMTGGFGEPGGQPSAGKDEKPAEEKAAPDKADEKKDEAKADEKKDEAKPDEKKDEKKPDETKPQ
jgi:hypothetical protein